MSSSVILGSREQGKSSLEYFGFSCLCTKKSTTQNRVLCPYVCLSQLLYLFDQRERNGHEETMDVGKEQNCRFGEERASRGQEKDPFPMRLQPIQPLPQFPTQPMCLPLPRLTYPKECASHLKNISKNRTQMSLKRG